jgi:hypothetical protein
MFVMFFIYAASRPVYYDPWYDPYGPPPWWRRWGRWQEPGLQPQPQPQPQALEQPVVVHVHFTAPQGPTVTRQLQPPQEADYIEGVCTEVPTRKMLGSGPVQGSLAVRKFME